MAEAKVANIYGLPPKDLVGDYADARQFSPLIPGAEDLAEVTEASLDGLAMLALPGTVERRHEIALALLALHPDSRFVVLAPKDKGGSRLAGDLKALGCAFEETARRHHRLCVTTGSGDASAIAAALAEGEPRYIEELGLWSQPGVFSWDRIDPGSALLLAHLPALSGAGADFGCGIGVLARAVLVSPGVTHLTMIDVDRRAIALARRNIVDGRADMRWADTRTTKLTGLDFVVMNPPFHEGGTENQALGQTFIARAATALRKGGSLWLTANRHLPYEAILKPLFQRVTAVAASGGYKIYQAQK
jgi:16S rRNA (guanine1207-N2)-methyltransferase